MLSHVLRDVQNSAAFPLMSHGSHGEHEVLNLGGELLPWAGEWDGMGMNGMAKKSHGLTWIDMD